MKNENNKNDNKNMTTQKRRQENDNYFLFQVCLTEGRNLSRQFDAAFQEVSVANCPEIAIDVLNKLIRHLRNTRKVKRNKTHFYLCSWNSLI